LIQATSNSARQSLHTDDLLTLNEAQIWTASDLCQLRAVVEQRLTTGEDSVCIDLSRVTHLPSGFFGLLCHFRDQGINVSLYETRQSVCDLIWFQRFFQRGAGNSHCFREEPRFMSQ